MRRSRRTGWVLALAALALAVAGCGPGGSTPASPVPAPASTAAPAAASEPLPAAPTETALLDAVFRIDVDREQEERARRQADAMQPPGRASIRVENENLVGLKLASIPGLSELEITITRVKSAGANEVVLALEEVSRGIQDPVAKLRYIRSSLARYQQAPLSSCTDPSASGSIGCGSPWRSATRIPSRSSRMRSSP